MSADSPRTEAGKRLLLELEMPWSGRLDGLRLGQVAELGYRAAILAIEAEAAAAALDRLRANLEREMSTSRHRLEKTGALGAPACSCGGYDSTDESLPAEAWRLHLTAAVLAILDAKRGRE